MGCCMVLCMLTGSRVTWTSLFFSDLQVYLYLTCICCIFLYMVSWAIIFQSLRRQHTPCQDSFVCHFSSARWTAVFCLKKALKSRSPCEQGNSHGDLLKIKNGKLFFLAMSIWSPALHWELFLQVCSSLSTSAVASCLPW